MTDAVWLRGISLPEQSSSMDSRSRNFSITVGFLILGISCNQGKLLTISRLDLSAESVVETTCVSENDSAALVWNTEKLRKVPDFVPRKPKATDDNSDCAIWENDRCFVNWRKIENHLVASWLFPMGPVLDYRWESFRVHHGYQIGYYSRYRYFSVRDYRAVLNIWGYARKKSIVITLERSLNESSLMICAGLIDVDHPGCSRDGSVTPLGVFQENQDDDMFGIREWRTFGIKLHVKRGEISVIEGDKMKTFGALPVSDFLTEYHQIYGIYSWSLMKFHRYYYILSKEDDELLSTSDFHLRSEDFCIELFVGLCSDCQLVVTLRSRDETIPIGSIDGNNNSMFDGLLVWRSVRLDATIPKHSSEKVRLELRTRLKNVDALGRWAVDSIRWCEPAGSLRTSTVTSKVTAGKYVCQKISYDESVVARSYQNETLGVPSVSAREIRDYSRGLNNIFGSLCPHSGSACLICNPTGCTCDRGFEGSKCDKECGHGYYGYGCGEECHRCANRSCDRVTGYCAAGCSNEKLLPPLCIPEIPEDDGGNKGQHMIWLTVSAIPFGIVLLVIGYRVWFKNLRSTSETPANVPAEPLDCDGYLVPSVALNRRNWIFPAMMNLDDGNLYEDIGSDGPPYDPRNHKVEIARFKHYLEDGFASGLLKSQYEHVSDGPSELCEYGKLLPNLAKNRSRNTIAYDKTRVLLEKIAGDSHSDYINANYIRGYRQVPAYIATQGPTPNTIGDFWRMVWQEKTTLICMVSNLMEDDEVLCEQYWPEVQKSSKYEFIVVLNAGEVEFDNCVLRTFHLQCGDETREVTHLHYTGSWPSRGSLTYSSSLVTYLKKLLAIPSGDGLVVVHGSLGVGRTGVIILCDICLRRALHDKICNVPATMIRMREDRGNMVENEHYYLLAHVLISGCLLSKESRIADYTEILY